MKKVFAIVLMAMMPWAYGASVNLGPQEGAIRSFVSIFGANHLTQGASIQGMGLAARVTLPAATWFYIGFTTDGALYNWGDAGANASVGLSTDLKFIGNLYISADYGYTWLIDPFRNPWRGNYYAAGMHWWVSQYIDISVMYRENIGAIPYPEIRYALNIPLTMEMFEGIAMMIDAFN
ncbi:MAG: hypothetical protein KU37_08040 [Sulfuricurvum sp. PC08-66]|nr:MAG: hypothetical protein KU37_08040 [Sulfuricurvum sp. PC08-66]